MVKSLEQALQNRGNSNGQLIFEKMLINYDENAN